MKTIRSGLPKAVPGMTIGLLGGSFDPAHNGHVHITREALRRFGLDCVWWLVSPGNPLKPQGPAPIARRMAEARRIMRHPRVAVTDIEARMGTRYTAQTLKELKRRYPGVHFVWLMGSDNLVGFDRWDRWQWIMEAVPVGVIARPGCGLSARLSNAARRYSRFRLPQERARQLATSAPPAWCFVNVPLRDISSSQIRARGLWAR